MSVATAFAHFPGAEFATLAQVTPEVTSYISALPSSFTYEYGNIVRDAIISQIAVSTPGSNDNVLNRNPWYNIFYVGFITSIYTNAVRAQMELTDGNKWADYATALQCQSIWQNTHNVRDRLDITKINTDMQSFDAWVTPNAWKLYSYVLQNSFFRTQYNALTDHNAAKVAYMNYLVSPSFVQSRIALYTNLQWNGPYFGYPGWEMFHHYLKLNALGASDGEINSLISTLKSLGLPSIPEAETNWKTFKGFLKSSALAINHNDIDLICAYAQMKTDSVFYYGYSYPLSFAEANSEIFTDPDKPGGKYIKPKKSGSCFVAGTRVLMADGTTKKIEAIISGDLIATPDGPWTVLALATPPRRGRTLYSFNDQVDIQFTATHPIINLTPGQNEKYTSINPEQLKELVPLIVDHGVSRLDRGSVVASWNPASQTTVPYHVNIINEHPSIDPQEVVYDVVVAPDDDFHTPSYIVVGSGIYLLVSSEVPPFEGLPHATAAVMKIFSHSLPFLVDALQNVSTEDLDEHMRISLHGITANIVSHSDYVRDNLITFTPNQDSLSEHISGTIFGGLNEYDTLSGEVYDCVFAGLVEEILAITELDPDVYHSHLEPVADEMLLAVSILYFDAGQLPSITASDLNAIKVTWINESGVKQDEQYIVNASQARYSTRFIHRFYHTLYFPDYSPNDNVPHQLSFEFTLANTQKLYASQYVPHLANLTARFVTPIVMIQAGGVASEETGRLGLLLRYLPARISSQELNSQQITNFTPLNEELIHSIGAAISASANFSQAYINLRTSLTSTPSPSN